MPNSTLLLPLPVHQNDNRTKTSPTQIVSTSNNHTICIPPSFVANSVNFLFRCLLTKDERAFSNRINFQFSSRDSVQRLCVGVDQSGGVLPCGMGRRLIKSFRLNLFVRHPAHDNTHWRHIRAVSRPTPTIRLSLFFFFYPSSSTASMVVLTNMGP